MASVAICTAVWKPNVKSVAARSLSMVFGTPTDRDAGLGGEARGHAERVLAADRDQGVDALALERVEHPRHAVVGPGTGWYATCRGWCRRGGSGHGWCRP